MRKIFCVGSGALTFLVVFALVAAIAGTIPGLISGFASGWMTCRLLKRYLRVNVDPEGHTPADKLYSIFTAIPFMDGPTFERFVGATLEERGYTVTLLGGSGDQGVDIIALHGEDKIAVQCKNHTKPVNNKAVQEVYAGSRFHDCNKAAVVSPSGFTKGAMDLASATQVHLYDKESLRIWIKEIKGRERHEQSNQQG